jgi:HEAT repeat protein
MRACSLKLKNELAVWKHWELTASHEEDGWESDAPNWKDLIEQAQKLMLETDLAPDEVSQLEEVFCLSEEDEVLADFVKENYESVPKDTIRKLLLSSDPKVRWQVYDSLVATDEFGERALLQGVEDPDTYVRRRAFLRLLSSGRPSIAVLERAATDPDSVIRDQAKKLLI